MTSLLSSPVSKIDGYWIPHLSKVTKPSAVQLLTQLSPDNIIGYDSRGSRVQMSGILRDVERWKHEHPDKIILVRIGEFFEVFGLDAVLLVQHAGLNPMAGKCRAGCPRTNLTQTLSALTDAGLSVAVFEEANDVSVAGGPRAKKRKHRFLAQVVTPGMPTFLTEENCLSADELPYCPAKPFGFLRQSGDCFSLVLIHADSKEVRVSENLTEDGVLAMVEATGGLAEPAYLAEGLNITRIETCLPTRIVRVPGAGPIINCVNLVSERVAKELALPAGSLSELRSVGGGLDARMSPLYKSAAVTLGLQQTAGVPSLADHLLPPEAPAHAMRFLTRWLLCPPPAPLRDAFRILLQSLTKWSGGALPQFKPVPVEKLVRLLESKSANASLFLDIRTSCLALLNSATLGESIAQPLLKISTAQSGVVGLSLRSLIEKLELAVAKIESTVYLTGQAVAPSTILPQQFIEANEATFRRSVRIDVEELNSARLNLEEAISIDFGEAIQHDSVNNLIYWKPKAKHGRDDLIKAVDRRGDHLNGKFTTEKVQAAMDSYIRAAEDAEERAKLELRGLSESLCLQQKELIVASHWSVVASAAIGHCERALRRGWTLPEIVSPSPGSPVLKATSLIPYWLDGSAVPSDIEMNLGTGPVVLTAPNMSGKSTYIRSLCALSLLGNSGLMVPAKNAIVAEAAHLLVVAPGGDRPAEGLSAFAVETQAVAIALRDTLNTPQGSCAVVLVDEFGRGTSPLDGVALTASLLESYIEKADRVCCVFATHLHEVFNVDIKNGHRLSWKQMVGHHVESGRCFNSLGIETSLKFGLPDSVTARAHEIRDTLLQRSNETKPQLRPAPVLLDDLVTSMLGSDSITLDPKQNLPPRIQAAAVVYILYFDDGVYVGETENFEKRLSQHKVRFGKDPMFCKVSPQVSKSAARRLETVLIKSIENIPGVTLLSRADGNRHCSAST